MSGSSFVARRLLNAKGRSASSPLPRSLSTARPSKTSGGKKKNKVIPQQTPSSNKRSSSSSGDKSRVSKPKDAEKRKISSAKRQAPKKTKVKRAAGAEYPNNKNDPPIIIPGGTANASSARTDVKSLSTASPYYHAYNNRFGGGGGSFRLTKILPSVNASALLNPKYYIKKSALPGGTVTISGADAARRLLKGRQDLLDVLRQELAKKGHQKRRNPPKPYALLGHGVPQQLLQDHVNMADALLKYHGHAAECSFTNFHGDLCFGWVRIRARNGQNSIFQWPHPGAEREVWEHQMELYMTVMNRLASNLGLVLRREPPPAVSFDHEEEQDDDFVTYRHGIDPLAATTPRYWRVELLRGMAYPPSLIPQHADVGPVIPIVEWTPQEGASAPGHVCIRLQGFPSSKSSAKASSLRRKKKVPVTLVFDACFRNNVSVVT